MITAGPARRGNRAVKRLDSTTKEEGDRRASTRGVRGGLDFVFKNSIESCEEHLFCFLGREGEPSGREREPDRARAGESTEWAKAPKLPWTTVERQ